MPYLSGFFGITVPVKGQRQFRSITCLSTVNEKFQLYFHSYMDGNDWKITNGVNWSTPGPEKSNISA